MGLINRTPWIGQPQCPVQIDWSAGILSPETTIEVLLPSIAPGFGLKTGKLYPLGSTPPTKRVGAGGVGASFAGGSATSFIELAASADSILSTTKCTILILRSLNSLSFSTGIQHGYGTGSADGRVAVCLPYSNGIIYWDFDNAYDGSGRVASQIAQSWEINSVDAFALVAGPIKGREIWRNGIKIGTNTAAVASRNATAYGFNVGASAGTAGGANPEAIYQFIPINDELSDIRLLRWFRKPWSIIKPQSRRLWAPPSISESAVRGRVVSLLMGLQ